LREGGNDVPARLTFAFRLCTARVPNERESAILRQLFERSLAKYRQDPAAAARLVRVGESPQTSSADAVELAAWTAIGNVLLNLDETISKG
jgi:hypothetical protein